MTIGLVFAQTCVSPPAGLIGWWPGDGDATDIAGSADGTLLNGATFAPGIVGQAFHFDGANDFVGVADSDSLDFGTGDFTVAFWVRFDDLDDTGNGLLSKDTYAGDIGTVRGIVFNICGLCGGGAFGVGSGGVGIETRDRVGGAGPWTHARYATSNFNTGTWYYIAGVRRSNILYLFVDGVLRATTAEPLPANVSNTAPMTFGALTPASPQHFKGELDEVDVYNRALDDSEIQAIFDAGSAGKCRVPATPPNLQIGAIKAPASSAPGAEINIRDTTRNAGAGGSGETTTRLWLSANKTVGTGDVDLGSRLVPALAAGAQHVATTAVTLPDVAPGFYYVLAQADADADAAESNEGDNVKAKAILLGPDLTVKSMVFSPSSPTSSAPVTITLTINNLGGATAGGSITRIYRSGNGKLDGSDSLLAELPLGALGSGGTAAQATSLTLPAGTYYVLAIVDAANTVAEAKETNNLKKAQKTVP